MTLARTTRGWLAAMWLVACTDAPTIQIDGGATDAALPDAGRDAGAATDAWRCPDVDGDGHAASTCGGDDCDDADPMRHPGATEVCDPAGRDEDCDPATFGTMDADHDGHVAATCCNGSACGDDCNDTVAAVYAGATETCNGADDDCDTAVDEGLSRTAYRDVDMDLHGDPATMATVACMLPAGFVEVGDDCDDARADRNPGATEACDGIDNDCDTRVDEGIGTTYWPDADGDGFGDAHGAPVTACSAPAHYASNDTDCDDTRQLVNPATTELCDGLDNNCNGVIDESGPRSFFHDVDGDGFGDAGDVVMITACTPPSGYVAISTDCNDRDASVHPGAAELCDGLDGDCSLGLAGGGRDASEDRDGDLHSPIAGACSGGPFPKDDCNDASASIYGGAPEVCDGLDDDCSSGGGLDASEDADFDLHSPPSATCAGGPFPRNDCVDTNATIHGGALELCDGLDDDCSSGGGIEPAEERDGDGHAPAGTLLCSGGSLPRDDCDDTRLTVYPGAPELCDGLDTNCSSGGGAASSEDQDGDHHSAPSALCSGGPYAMDDCNDAVATTYGGAPELCDRVDDDCSSGGGVEASEDVDSDGYASPSAACSGGALPKTDCVDSNATIHPGAPELCDRLDDDCASGGGVVSGEDADGDLHASPSAACSGGFPKDDCDDGNTNVYAGAPELCDRIDDDCSSGGGVLASEDQDNDMHAPIAAMCTGGPLPKDDCDDADPTRYPGAAPVAPPLLAPANGAMTGSYRASASLRPTFRWATRGGCALTYELQVDDSCSAAGYASCAFPSPEIAASGLTSTSYTPSAPMAVSSTAPVGTRYFWRVRQCSGSTCSAWSAVRYVDVGRAPSDYNGDGYSDVVVDAMWQGTSYQGVVYAYYGTASGTPSAPSFTLASPNGQGTDTARGEFGAVAFAGDVDADGFGDLVVGQEHYHVGSSFDDGIVYLLRGSAMGLSSTPSVTIPTPTLNGHFGFAVSAAGDVNADGYADVIVGSPFTNSPGRNGDGTIYLLHGQASGLPTSVTTTIVSPDGTDFARMGWSVSSAGDVDGDGYADVIAGGPYTSDASASQRGKAWVFRGSASGVLAASRVTLLGPVQANAQFGRAVSEAGDVNGDGYGDVAVGAPVCDVGTSTDQGAVLVFLGSASGVVTTSTQTLTDPNGLLHANYGWSVDLAGDVNGDGFADLAVGIRQHSPTDQNDGAGAVVPGTGTALDGASTWLLPNPTAFHYAYEGTSIAGLGDVDGDGYADVGVGAPDYNGGTPHEGNVFVHRGSASGPPTTPSTILDNPLGQNYGQFGQRLW